MKKLTNLLFLPILLTYPNNMLTKCLEKRYAFDIGSGATKTQAYLVDVCNNKIIKPLKAITKHIKYQECISNSSDKQTISSECISNGLEVMKQLKREYGTDCVKEKCAGIATAWARNAKNADQLLQEFKQFNIHIQSVSQKTEGELGYKSAISDVALKDFDKDSLIIWDIGGGSFQLSTMLKNNTLHIYEGPYGIFNFAKKMADQFPNFKGNQPNIFYDKQELDLILPFASKNLGKLVLNDKELKKRIKSPDLKVIGVGRIMNLGIRIELNLESTVTKDQMKGLIYELGDMTLLQARAKYPKLPDHFAHLIQQALIIVYGIMDGAGIDEMLIIESDLTDDVATSEQYWVRP